MLSKLIDDFIKIIQKEDFELYNEAGLQHELGYFLRTNNFQIYFEYDLDLIINNDEFLKKELDLYIKEGNELFCIELKFPTNKAFPRRMTQSIIDIFFLQQLINNNFKKCYFLFITDLKGFKEGQKKDKIYSYFRNSKSLSEFSYNDIPKFMLDSKNKAGQKLYNLLRNKKLSLNEEHKIYLKEFKKNNRTYYYYLLKIE